jgi:gliding motility-associated-like protein
MMKSIHCFLSKFAGTFIIPILSLLLIIGSGSLHAQVAPTSGDCLGGFRVCFQSYTQPLSFVGEGNLLNEIDPASSCLISGERNNAWYIITVQSPGLFGFNIIPNVSNADYDWVVFDITNATCADIGLGIVPVLGCDYQSNVTPSPVTGMNNGVNPQDEPMIVVNTGDILALCVNNFSGLNNAGYTLQFNIPGVTANVIDNIPPGINPTISNISCGAKLVNFSFDEFVDCASVDLEDFVLINPLGDTLEILSVIGQSCANGGTYEKDFVMVLNDPLNIGGVYSMWRVGQVVDLCGNVAANPEVVNFNIVAFDLSFLNPVDATCPNNNGGITLDIANVNPTDLFTINWEPSGLGSGPAAFVNPIAVNQLPYGTNWVTVENQNGCIQTDTFRVEDAGGFDVGIEIVSDTCTSGKGRIYLFANQNTMPVPPANFQYFWNPPAQTVNNDTITGLITGMYSFTVTNPAGCAFRDSALVPDFRYSLSADFLYSPDENPITGIFPTITFINLSQFATEFIWDFGSGDSSDVFEPQYIFPSSGTFDVQLTAINQFGCKDSVTKQITIDFFLNTFFPTAFTPDGDNINDTFNFVTTGIFDSTFEMQIFDRWGNVIYETKEYRQGWDGKNAAGTIVPTGMYIYKIFFYDQSGKKRQFRGRFMVFT